MIPPERSSVLAQTNCATIIGILHEFTGPFVATDVGGESLHINLFTTGVTAFIRVPRSRKEEQNPAHYPEEDRE